MATKYPIPLHLLTSVVNGFKSFFFVSDKLCTMCAITLIRIKILCPCSAYEDLTTLRFNFCFDNYCINQLNGSILIFKGGYSDKTRGSQNIFKTKRRMAPGFRIFISKAWTPDMYLNQIF